MGLEAAALAGFPTSFREGMTGGRRPELFGDHDDCAPIKWAWGNDANPVHVLVLLYAADAATLAASEQEHRQRATADGLAIVGALPAAPLGTPLREPFGFADGLSQPPIAGIDAASDTERFVATGEFLLGYQSQYESFIYPLPQPDTLGRNGSFVAFRILEQDCTAFERLQHVQFRLGRSQPAPRVQPRCERLYHLRQRADGAGL